MEEVILILFIFSLLYLLCVLFGCWIFEHIERNYSENPIWKIVIWLFPIGLIAIFVFKISDWIDDIRDYYRWRK